ncbi:MAG: Rpn family recombination-promoting nuclease/putative transposase, partial [Muribaculaceae bacterium]|nr:Rpn family recombination-promoting nuclease/putative transposase [Muribaculaceae bacterium]
MKETSKKTPRYMHLLTDYAFKRLFGSEKHKPLLIDFLNSALGGKENVVDVEFRDKEMLPFVEDGKRMVFDIYCTTSNGSHIIVEMQRTLQPSFSNRALAYCSHSLVKQILKGERYHFEKVYGIFIMNFHLVDKEPRLVRRISLIDEDTHEIFSDKMHMIFFDLKMMKKRSLATCRNDLERRLFLFKNMEKMEEKDKNFPMYD